jgi:isoquinoline 1-oxidoreductase beta subunit
VNRREFVTWAAAGGIALAVRPARADTTVSPWIQISADGRITLTSTALEMGQGSRTGQAQILACELEAPWDAIEVRLAPETEPFLLDGELYSGGSETVRTRYELLRRAGATVRFQLIAAAAQRWHVDPGQCRAELGEVIHAPSGRRLGYGDLAALAATIRPPDHPPLKSADQRRYIGRPIPSLGLADKVCGKALFGIDVRVPGMLRATILQCPTAGGTLAAVEERPALAVPGVRRIVRLRDAVAVVADSTWQALRGAAALQPRWHTPTGKAQSSSTISESLAQALDGPDARVIPRDGGSAARQRLRAAFAGAERRCEATYELAYLSHSPLEPMNAIARADDTRAEIWAPCQAPTSLRREVAQATGIELRRVTVHPQLMGGGFGRRLKGDYAVRAVQVAQVVGRPVQVLWTREEDMGHDFYRPAMVMQVRAALDADGLIPGYEVIAATADDFTGSHAPAPYRLNEYAATLSNVAIGVPIGSWRSVDAGMALFAKESFIDECAHLAGIDPLAYRDRLLGDHPRARRVLQAAAAAIGWSTARAPGVGRGLALLEGWDGVVAHAIEVRVTGRRLEVIRLVAAVDCGVVVNPRLVRMQFEGGGLMALSAALTEKITIEGSAVQQRNFDTYSLLRLPQAPRIDVVLLETAGVKVGGVGEPPVPGVAPALANAIFQATGERIRRLPIRDAGFEV